MIIEFVYTAFGVLMNLCFLWISFLDNYVYKELDDKRFAMERFLKYFLIMQQGGRSHAKQGNQRKVRGKYF